MIYYIEIRGYGDTYIGTYKVEAKNFEEAKSKVKDAYWSEFDLYNRTEAEAKKEADANKMVIEEIDIKKNSDVDLMQEWLKSMKVKTKG